MSKISENYVEWNIVVASNYAKNWNEVFNEIKTNLKDFDYEESFNRCVKYLIKLYQVSFTRSSGNNRKETNCT